MKRVTSILLAVYLVLCPLSSLAATGDDYRLSPNDVLTIGVWGFEELQVKELVIREDGKIGVPLAGEMQAGGLSVAQLTDTIIQGLKPYINNPKVTVNIFKYHTTRVYVLGEVVKPGLYDLDKQHNLIDAVSAAGGSTKDASKKKVFVISKDSKSKPQEADLLRLLRMGDMKQNLKLNDGDVVYLAENHRIDFARDILPLITAIYDMKHFNN